MGAGSQLFCGRAAAVAMLLLLGACATVQPPPQRHLQSADAAARDCVQWFSDLDAEVTAVGVRDREAAPVPGFPYLRSTRFLSSLADVAAGDPELRGKWLVLMREADQQAHAAELRNLPAGGDAGARSAVSRKCGDLLMRADLADAGAMASLKDRVHVPDAYQDWQRVAGVYALSRIPFAGGVARWHAEAEEMFRKSREGVPSPHPVERYAPQPGEPYTRAQVAELLARAATQPFGIPHLDQAEQSRLLVTYAPVFEVETTGAFDRPGALKWADADHPVVDVRNPVVYQRITHARYRGRTLLQLVYTMWFSERPPDHALDMLAGKLDGLVWRVTLAQDGSPLLFDTMHPCGCFHMFLPTPLATALPAPDPDDEWAFIPASLPVIGEGERVRLRLATRSHYLLDAGIEGSDAPAAHPYAFLPESQLRSLPLPSGGYRSAYGSDALVPGTERPERYLFWPMGIPSAGAMRQWGNHATAFLGRRHFDDADLVERRFELKLP